MENKINQTKIILVGDATSGKTTFLNHLKKLQNKKIKIVTETGWGGNSSKNQK